MTSSFVDDFVAHHRRLRAGDIPRAEHLSWFERMEVKLRYVYSAITCIRATDVRPRPAADLPRRSSVERQDSRPEVTPPRRSSHTYDHPRPRAGQTLRRPPPPDQAGGSGWHGDPAFQQTLRRPPPPDQAGGSGWHGDPAFQAGGPGYYQQSAFAPGGDAYHHLDPIDFARMQTEVLQTMGYTSGTWPAGMYIQYLCSVPFVQFVTANNLYVLHTTGEPQPEQHHHDLYSHPQEPEPQQHHHAEELFGDPDADASAFLTPPPPDTQETQGPAGGDGTQLGFGHRVRRPPQDPLTYPERPQRQPKRTTRRRPPRGG